jgi:hypothetical protein
MESNLRTSLRRLGQIVDSCLSRTSLKHLAAPAPDRAQSLSPLYPGDWATAPQDTVCVQDVSSSIGWQDCKPSRLIVSTKAAATFAQRRAALSPGDRLAVVTFSTHARVALPLTGIGHQDRIVQHLSALKAGGGTDIAQGLMAAYNLLAQDALGRPMLPRYRRVLLLTDGHGGRPLTWAKRLKRAGVLIEVVGFGGDPAAVDEALLRKVATTDANGFVHYWFFRDADGLIAHYESLATGIVFKGQGS